MLTLPEEWRRFHGGAICTHLFEQVTQPTLQTEFAGHLIVAALDLVVGRLGETASRPPVRVLPDFHYQIGEYIWVYLAPVNDDALEKAIALGSCSPTAMVIVPPGYQELLRQACEPILKSRTPMISSLDLFIALRVHFASCRLHCDQDRVVVDLLRRSNQRAIDANSDKSILVDIPADFG